MINDEETMEIYQGKSDVEDAKYLISYINDVLKPASNDFFNLLDDNKLQLHQAFSFNSILAHAIDYMVFIATKQNEGITRSHFLKNFDDIYSVAGCKHINNKFSLLDAVNNSFKHVELELKRYKKLIDEYGELSFKSIKSKDGKIFFSMPLHSFDYARVVLRPVAKIFHCGITSTENVDDFINGRIRGSSGYGSFSYEYEPFDAIDRMIDYCNPECMDCGEGGDDCNCPSFVYSDKRGQFNPNIDPRFEFTDVMSEISGTREWSK
jgi:hypothetical protein